MSLLWGHAWHGVWRPGGLTLPNGNIKNIAWAPQGPADAWPEFGLGAFPVYGLGQGQSPYPWPSHGDCMDVAVPGMPAVTTPAQDVAAGREWRNYALMSGASHSFCGTRLGGNRFIYVAQDGSVWLASLDSLVNDSTLKMTFRRFGQFGQPAVPIQVAIARSNPTGKPLVADASRTGKYVCYSLKVPSDYPPFIGGTLCFTGTPGSSLTVVDIPLFYDGSNTVTEMGYGERSSGVISSEAGHEIGHIFDGDLALPVSHGYVATVTARSRLPDMTFTPVTISGAVFIKVGTSVYSIPFTVVQSWAAVAEPGFLRRSVTLDFDGGTYNYSIRELFSEPGLGHWMSDVPGVTLTRRSNRVVEAVLVLNGDPILGAPPSSIYSATQRSLCLALPDRFVHTGYDIPADGSRTVWFSYNPVTRDLLSESSPVCWM